MKTEITTEGTATYCPEDDKLRLYVGRVPRPEYDRLRSEGWTATPKQDCDFVAVWTPSRYATALEFAETVEDEDQSPADRAADRAERFAGYLGKRLDEAENHADRYESQPSAHGFQSQARADRSARRHDRIGTLAYDAWSKAEYWQRRTAGVIGHALHKCAPGVRMGRIKTIESDLRKIEKRIEEYSLKFQRWQQVAAEPDAAKARAMAYHLANTSGCESDHTHPRTGKVTSIYSMLTHGEDKITGHEAAALWLHRLIDPASEAYEHTGTGRWRQHLKNRLAYEWQMIGEQGGREATTDMIPGGFIGGRQIQKVNKSSATGRVVSVLVNDNKPSAVNHYGNPYPEGVTKILSHVIKTERLALGSYRAPTTEELKAFNDAKKEAKKAAPKAEPCPLINPTDDDAQRLQDVWNERALDEAKARKAYTMPKPQTVVRITQAQYSAASGGTYSSAGTRLLFADATLDRARSNMWTREGKNFDDKKGAAFCKIRYTSASGEDFRAAPRVIVLTDKAQKALPAGVWKAAPAEVAPEPEPVTVGESAPLAPGVYQVENTEQGEHYVKQETVAAFTAQQVEFAL